MTIGLRAARPSGVASVDAGLRAYMLRVYNYMLVGLGLTGAVAWLTANTPLVHVFYNQVQTANGDRRAAQHPGLDRACSRRWRMVFFLSFRIQKMSFATAQTTFWAYAARDGRFALHHPVCLYRRLASRRPSSSPRRPSAP